MRDDEFEFVKAIKVGTPRELAIALTDAFLEVLDEHEREFFALAANPNSSLEERWVCSGARFEIHQLRGLLTNMKITEGPGQRDS